MLLRGRLERSLCLGLLSEGKLVKVKCFPSSVRNMICAVAGVRSGRSGRRQQLRSKQQRRRRLHDRPSGQYLFLGRASARRLDGGYWEGRSVCEARAACRETEVYVR